MIKMVLKGMRRRKKEIRYVSVVTFMAVLFMAAITLFQSIMDNYLYERNIQAYGNWMVSSVGQKLAHPYFSIEAACTTGISLADENGDENGIMMGKVDESFKLVQGDCFYEGRMPENGNEIAMDTVSLAELGYNYDLGQTITIRWVDSSGTVKTKDYELVGTMKCFSRVWETEGSCDLPNFFLTEEEFGKYGIKGTKTYFYQISQEYSDINTFEFAQSFKEGENHVAYNSYVYENKFWDSTEVYESVTKILMAISVLAISYLLIAYTGKRRGVYYRYRCIGASKNQVRAIVAFECIYATLPMIVMGMAVAYLGAYGICHFVGSTNGMDNLYVFDGHLLAEQLISIVGVVLVAVLATQFSISERRLTGNTGTVKPSRYKRLRRIAAKSRKPEKTIFKRQRIVRPVQSIVSAVFTVIVCGSLVFCIYKIQDSVDLGLSILDMKDDFYMDKSGSYKFEMGESTYNLDLYDMYDGLEDNALKEIEACLGIAQAEKEMRDEMHYFQWKGMENSPLIKLVTEGYEGDLLYVEPTGIYGMWADYNMSISFYDDMSKYCQEVTGWNGQGSVDWEEFERGDSVILLINNERWLSEEIKLPRDETIAVGDSLDIMDRDGNKVMSVKVGEIRYCEGYSDDFYTSGYKMVASVSLAQRMAELEGKEPQYNVVKVAYDETSSYQSTDKQMAKIATKYGAFYYSEAEYIRITKQEMVQDIGIYGTVFLLILVIYIVIQRNFMVSKNKYWRERFKLLKQIGMEDKQYAISAFVAECKSFLWIFAGLFAGYLMMWYSKYIEYFKAFGDKVETLYVDEIVAVKTYKYALDDVMQSTEHIWLAAVTAGVYIVMIISSALVIRKCIKRGEEK